MAKDSRYLDRHNVKNSGKSGEFVRKGKGDGGSKPAKKRPTKGEVIAKRTAGAIAGGVVGGAVGGLFAAPLFATGSAAAVPVLAGAAILNAISGSVAADPRTNAQIRGDKASNRRNRHARAARRGAAMDRDSIAFDLSQGKSKRIADSQGRVFAMRGGQVTQVGTVGSRRRKKSSIPR